MSKRPYRQNFVGQRFGRLTVLSDLESHRQPNGDIRRRGQCRCDCGATVSIPYHALTAGTIKSCGCLKSELASKRLTTHGETRRNLISAEYTAHQSMIARCENPKHKSFKDYGGRGIAICPRWRHGENGISGFECFLVDMGRKPSPAHSIERDRVNEDYSPDNCRWATKREQMRNMRSNRLVLCDGERVPLVVACERSGVNYVHVRKYIWRGQEPSEAIARAKRNAEKGVYHVEC